jgi:hypothetical protein
MAGRMGNESVTVKNLRVLQVDEENGIVVVNGTYIISFCRLMSREIEKGLNRLEC